MSTVTAALNLVKMENGEYVNSWGDIVNQNLDKVDTAVGALQTLTSSAEGAYSTINDRLGAMDTSIETVEAIIPITEPWHLNNDYINEIYHFGPNHHSEGLGKAAGQLNTIAWDNAALRVHVKSRDLGTGAFGDYIGHNAYPSTAPAETGLQLSEMIGLLSAARGSGVVYTRSTDWVARSGNSTLRVGDTAMLNGDVLVSVRGRLGIIRATDPITVTATGQTAGARFHLVATGVKRPEDAIARHTSTTGQISPSALDTIADTSLGAFFGVSIGDAVVVAAAAGYEAVQGTYLIEKMYTNAITIEGQFPEGTNLTGISYSLHRRYEVELELKKETTTLAGPVAGEIHRFRGGDAWSTFQSWEGTSLASIHCDLSGNFSFSLTSPDDGGIVAHDMSDTYDSGWWATSTLFNEGSGTWTSGDVAVASIPLASVAGYEIWFRGAGQEFMLSRPMLGTSVTDGVGINSYMAPVVNGITVRSALAIRALDTTNAILMPSSSIASADWQPASAVWNTFACRIRAWRS